MKKLIIIISLVVVSISINAQSAFKATTDTLYFFFYKNDTVLIEPMSIPPHAEVVSNFAALGISYVLSDKMQDLIDYIQNNGLKMSQYTVYESTRTNFLENGIIVINKTDVNIYTAFYFPATNVKLWQTVIHPNQSIMIGSNQIDVIADNSFVSLNETLTEKGL
jgi:hypothetical protein